MTETYTPSQFKRSLILRGIASERQAGKYMEGHQRTEYTENDIIDAYYEFHKEPIGKIIHGKAVDGQDMFSPAHDKSCRGRR